MAVGDERLWMLQGGQVVRVNPADRRVEGKPIPAPPYADAIAWGFESLWITSVGWGHVEQPNPADAVWRIDPRTGAEQARIPVGRAPLRLAVSNEAVWVVNFGAEGRTVTRIDPDTNRLVGRPIETGAAPISIAAWDGAVWVANHDERTVARIDQDSGRVTATTPLPHEPHRIAVGAGGVWVANFHNNSVTRIDPATGRIAGQPIPIGVTAGAITATRDSVWVTSDYRTETKNAADVVVVRIDPATGRAARTVPVGGHPIDVVAVEDAAWVAVAGVNRLLRLTP